MGQRPPDGMVFSTLGTAEALLRCLASEDGRGMYPPVSQVPGRLMFDLESAEGCARKMGLQKSAEMHDWLNEVLGDDHTCAYLGYAVASDEQVEVFADAYRAANGMADEMPMDLPGDRRGTSSVVRIREGVERFHITDINNPVAGALARSRLPVIIEWPVTTEERGTGGNVLYLDGLVEWVPYPGKWPMTEKTINTLRDLAELPPIPAP